MNKRILTRKGYENYIKAYKVKEAHFKKKGYSMYDQEGAYSYNEWKMMYEAKRHDRLELVKKGEAKVVGNINQYLVSEQAYEISIRQARALKKAAEIFGDKLSQSDIRAGNFNKQQLSQVYDYLREQGESVEEAQTFIAGTFFDSP